MEKENIIIRMELFTLETEKTINSMEKEEKNGLMALGSKDSISLGKKMEKVFLNLVMEVNFREIS